MRNHRTLLSSLAAFAALSLAAVGCGSGASHVATTATTATTATPATTASTATPATAATAAPRSAALWAPPGTASLGASSAAALQAALDAWVAQGKLTGITAAIVTPAGVWSGAAGVDGAGTRLKPESAMWIASVTKTFTAAEVMLLSSRGLVDLDKPLTDYIDVPFDTKGATVRQVLAMRSGFPNTTIQSDHQNLGADLAREWTVAEGLPKDAAGSSPGGTPEYNSVNYRLLGELIAKVTGRSLAQAIRSDLLDPAGLHRTWVQTAETPTPPLTVGIDPPGAKLVDHAGLYLPSRSVASGTSAAGSMASDAADVARWGYLLYGGQVIDTTLVKQMEADPQPEPNKGPYALGTMVSTDDHGVTMVGHSGGGTDWPYSAVLQVWTGSTPIAIAVLTPQPADFGNDIYDGFMHLHALVTG